MTDFAAFAGQRAIKASVGIPYYGTWCADVTLAISGTIPSAASVLVLGDLSLMGTVVRAASFAGSRSARIAGGFGGWPREVSAQAYRGSNVRASTVLRDAAALVGERVQVDANDTNLGRFTREAGPASRVLRQVAGPLWWTAPDGVTHVGPRASTPITSAFDVIGWSGKTGKFTIATEVLADWQPGRTFTAPTVSGAQTISHVSIEMANDGRLRLEVLAQ
jgi:hypothetical protein